MSSLGQYGDTPVSLYSGTTNVSLPLHTITSGNISLPISVSYNSKGVKVEEIASWVGLGWSLEAGGVITRSVRGIPDEIAQGYMDSTTATTVTEIIEEWEAGDLELFWDRNGRLIYLDEDGEFVNGMPWTETFGNLTRSLANNEIDGEADIFYYNFNGLTGKFHYNQQTGEIVSVPRSALYIDKAYFLANKKWRIIGPDGTEYYFDALESNLTYSACGGSASSPESVTTGWFLTRMYNPTTNSSINFSYDQFVYQNGGISSHTINQGEIGDVSDCAVPLKVCNSSNVYTTQRLKKIEFAGGRVEFTANTPRLDLIGDKRLDQIEIYRDSALVPFKKFVFTYSYFNNHLLSPTGNEDPVAALQARLKLQKIETQNAGGSILPGYAFEYNSTIEMPSRLSFSQDAWGYYNRATNSHMVPPYINLTTYWAGANRTVDTVATAMGVLKKVTYPTGGYTTFEYENNTVADYITFSSNRYLTKRLGILDASNSCAGSGGSPVFCNTITINDKRYGGAFINFRLDNINCWDCNADILPAPTTCALLSLGSMSLLCSKNYVFVPNGTYELKADFSGSSTNPSIYESFSIRMDWEEYNPPAGQHEAYIGGLRIKRIADYDGLGNVKYSQYKYEGGYISEPKFFYEYQMGCMRIDGGGGNYESRTFLVRPAYSSVPLGSESGNTHGYAKVTEIREGGSNGKTINYYSHAGQFPDIVFDYSSSSKLVTSFSHRRGLLVKQEIYGTDGGGDYLVKTIDNEYKPLDVVYDWTDPDINNPDSLYDEAINIKCVFLEISLTPTTFSPYGYPYVYKTISEWIRSVKTTERVYTRSGDYIETITTTRYENPLHLQPTYSRTLTGTKEVIQRSKYPLDYTVSGNPYGIKTLQNDHFISALVEQYTTVRESGGAEYVVGGLFRSYNNKGLPAKIYSLEHTVPVSLNDFTISNVTNNIFEIDPAYQERISFMDYDFLRGNLLQQQKNADIITSYLWGYDGTLPIAEVQNALHASIYHTSFEDTFGTSGSCVTGEKYYAGSSYTIPEADRPTGTNLKMTYWYLSNGEWKFKDTTYSATIAEATASGYDEIRVYPAGARMMTYAHNAGIGITSVNDANNQITYYDYDTFGRLIKIKDPKGNNLKSFEYHYKTSEP